ncbi:hypothetical protein D3C85_1629910 [compost metagenome]
MATAATVAAISFACRLTSMACCLALSASCWLNWVCCLEMPLMRWKITRALLAITCASSLRLPREASRIGA